MPIEALNCGRLTWTNITKATPTDIEKLGEFYTFFHPLDLEDCLSRMERPKIDEYDNYLFIVLHFPFWDSVRRISRPFEVDFFIGSGFLVTVQDGDLKPLNHLFELYKNDEEARNAHMSSGAGHLLHTIIDQLVDYIFPILGKVDTNIRSIEEGMFTDNIREVLQEISFVRRDIIALRRIIRPQLPILYNLEQVDRPFIREDLDVYFGDILDHLQKARDIVDDDAEVITGLADTIDVLAAHRINEVMRILTVISVIMLPLTLISGILGMNIPIPLQNSLHSFWITMGVMLLVSFLMLAYFRYRRWL
nr:magnesium transporter CorA family protein [Anaerolineae bacterium]